MKNDKLLSIVIPTRNRINYARNCILSLVNWSEPCVEIVVVDNSDGDGLEEWITTQVPNDSLVYVRVRSAVTVVDNFQIGIDSANGLYVCTIGDDDGINPEIIPLVKWAKEKNIDAITPTFIVDYFWPDLVDNGKQTSGGGGRLRIKKFSKKVFYPDIDNGFFRLAKSCGTDFCDRYYLPKIYYGIISRQVLVRCKNFIGSNFPGVSPDLSGAVAAAGFIKSFCVIDYPIFISGSSLNSTAGKSALKKHHGDLEKQSHISKVAIEQWPHMIPKFFGVETVWSQSAYASVRALGKTQILERFNYARIYAYSFMFNPSYYHPVMKALKLKVAVENGNLAVELSRVIREYCVWIWIRLGYLRRNFLNRVLRRTTIISGVRDINDASIVLSRYIRNERASLEFLSSDG